MIQKLSFKLEQNIEIKIKQNTNNYMNAIIENVVVFQTKNEKN